METNNTTILFIYLFIMNIEMNSKKLEVMKKIREEYDDLEVNSPGNLGISLVLVDDNIFKWKGGLSGPRQTPYNGGFFYLI